MNTNGQAKIRKTNRTLVLIVCAFVLISVGVVIFFYSPLIDQGVIDQQLPEQTLSLKIHILAYAMSYSLFLGGLVATGISKMMNKIVSVKFVQSITFIATFMAVVGLLMGFPTSEVMWGSAWVFDIKLVVTISATILLVCLSLLTLIPAKRSNTYIFVLMVFAVVLCCVMFAVGRGYGLTIHPQWFPKLFMK